MYHWHMCVLSALYRQNIQNMCVLEKMRYNSKTAEKACACSFATSEFSLKRRACNYKYYKLSENWSFQSYIASGIFFSPWSKLNDEVMFLFTIRLENK